jgi:carbon storage regulator CsrA
MPLSLSRKVGESIHIGDDIVVRVSSIGDSHDRNRVVLSIEAPRDRIILRGELVREEAMAAAEDAAKGDGHDG